MNMLQLFERGDVLEGFCNGFFGRDDYETKICVMVAPKFAVFQYENGFATVLNYEKSLENCVEDWKG